ncbi:MAG: ATP-binding protein [Candidatus Omnitrophica bacterium]|nr:ATP-binding protein [Candidatus Omnitrophota bacterium]
MFFYYTTSLLTVITSLALGIFVFFKNPSNKLHVSLFRMNTVVAAWSFFLFFHYASRTHQQAMATLYALHCAAILIPACFVHLACDLLDIANPARVRIPYIICGAFIPLVYSPYFINGIKQKYIFRYYANAGDLYVLWIITYCLMTGYGLHLMISRYRASSAIKKIQIRYILCASLIGFAGAATIYFLFYDISIPPFGEHIIFLYPVIFSIGVLKHDALELNIAIKRTIVYSVSIALITFAYLIIVLLSERFLQDAVGYQSIGISVGAAIVIALIFSPLKNRVEKIIEKFYMQNAYQRMQKELMESDKSRALAHLAAGLAHEIRNPLTAIKTFCEFLPKKFNDKNFRQDFSRIVNDETEKIGSLIDQLLEFAKPSSLKISACDVKQALDYTLNLLSAETLKSNIRVIKDYGQCDHIIQADTVKLKHVFFNIIKNGLESMGGNGVIRVVTKRTPGRLNIDIQDTGCGIGEKNLVRIFEPFFSLKTNGTGLGLPVSQSIILEHKGSIYAKSSPGAGTTFTISLPICF